MSVPGGACGGMGRRAWCATRTRSRRAARRRSCMYLQLHHWVHRYAMDSVHKSATLAALLHAGRCRSADARACAFVC